MRPLIYQRLVHSKPQGFFFDGVHYFRTVRTIMTEGLHMRHISFAAGANSFLLSRVKLFILERTLTGKISRIFFMV